uniref:NB-ARC domain-containing protein n=1 Tax=Oryza meridionalis TaxID=40149 RepID=A0A0E0F3E4_9ORYZ
MSTRRLIVCGSFSSKFTPLWRQPRGVPSPIHGYYAGYASLRTLHVEAIRHCATGEICPTRVIGRVDERKQAIEFLLHIDNNGSSPPDGCVLPIWGVKGVGKTTIARLVCDDRKNTYRTDFDSLFMLIYWLIWKERNTRIFQHIAKSVDRLADDINEEIAIWRAAGIFSQASE